MSDRINAYMLNTNSEIPTTRTDIEQETNGLYTQSRLEKLDAAKVKAVFEEAAQMFYERVNA